MKKIYFNLVVMSCAAFLLVSCIKDKDSADVSPLCAITSFSIGNITSYVTTTDASGNATTTRRVYSGSNVFFSIDQQAGTITSTEPLPSWITLGRVVAKFTSYGNVFQVIDSVYYGLTSGTDSVDVSAPRRLACMSTDGQYVKYYTLTLSKKAEASDSIVWEHLSEADLELSGSHRALTVTARYTDTEGADSLVKRLMVFSADEAGKPQVTSTTDGQDWTVPERLSGAEGTIDWTSVVEHQGRLYAIDDLGKLYASGEETKGTTWTKVADTQFKRLLCADGVFLYAYDGEGIVATADMEQWTPQGTENLDMLPERCTYGFHRQSNTNNEMTLAMMGGLSDNNTKYGVSWYKVTSLSPQYNQPWSYIQVSGENTHALPRLEELSTVSYGGNLYAMGRRKQTDGTLLFEGFYCSEDNGIAWFLQGSKWLLPKDLNAADGPASVALLGSTLYVVQDGGKVWRGVIN